MTQTPAMEAPPAPINLATYGYSILQIETYAACNMACTFCAYPTRDDKQSKLSEEVVSRALASVDPAAGSFEYVCFSQFNEPLLDPRMPQFIEQAQARGFKVFLITNGLLLGNRAIVDRLLQRPPNILKISLQTPRRDQYDAVRGVALDFDRYVEGIHRFVSAARGRPFEVVMDVGCNFLSPFSSWGRGVLGVQRGDPAVPNSVRELLPHLEIFLERLKQIDPAFPFEPTDVRQLLDATPRYCDEQGLRLAENVRLKIKPFDYGRRLAEFAPTDEPIACRNRILGILADGSVVPCCMAYNTDLAMGNLHRESLQTILDRARQLITNIKTETNQKPPTCKRCLGQPTKRGVAVSRLLGGLKPVLRKL